MTKSNSSFNEILSLYDYSIPEELVALIPTKPRDAARLLVFDQVKNTIYNDTFQYLHEYVPAGSILVFNQTKVIPARLTLFKKNGNSLRCLILEEADGLIKVILSKKVKMGAKLFINRKYFFTVEKNEQKYYFLKPQFQKDTLPEILEAFGTLPLPTYLKKTPLTHHELKKQYQTIFAYKAGSVAAPTASLHFTKRLISKLQKHSIEIAFVTLHVNEGTFAPIEEDNIKSNSLHKEYFEIDKQTADFLNNARKEKRPIIAVGTTVVRTLESASDTKGVLTTLQGTTDLFIREGYTFRFTDGIITNFHVPRSSLMMLVSAFVGHTVLLNLYRYAIQHKFRFFSFGDGMLILPRS